MIPATAIIFEADDSSLKPAFFISRASGAVAAMTHLGQSGRGLLWLTGPEKFQPSHFPQIADGYFLKGCSIEVDHESFVVGDRLPRPGSLIVHPGGTSIRTTSSTGGTRLYSLSGLAFDDKLPFAAFERWEAFGVSADLSRTAIFALHED